MNVLRWCPFIHLFDTPFQNSPYGHGLNMSCSRHLEEDLDRQYTIPRGANILYYLLEYLLGGNKVSQTDT